jgi:tetratricopeptide (TPR) repeat protein
VELEPLSPFHNSNLAIKYYSQRDYNHAIEQANKTLEIDPNYLPAIWTLGGVYAQLGNYKQAIEQWIKAIQLSGGEERAKEMKEVSEKSGYKGVLRKFAKDSEAEGQPYSAAISYAKLGEKDAAFAALEKAVALGQGTDDIKTAPDLDNLRSDPRYADLLRRIGLPQ